MASYEALEAPSFADDTGDAISGTVGTAIAPITVPEADGEPAPTYAVSGLPGGLAFNATTRVLSGTPTAAGSGTITVTATNSAGTADWTVTYAFAAATPTDQTVTAEGRHDTRGEAAVSEEAPPLTLADWTAPAGIDMRVLALIETGTLAGNEVFDTADNRGALVDGDNILENVDGADSITVGRFQATSDGGQIVLNRRAGSANFSAGFGGETGESYAGATTYIQFADGTLIELEDSDINNAGAGGLRYDIPSMTGWRDAVVTLRTSGVLFILGVGIPEAATDQTVTAEGRHETRGGASVTEEVPPPFPATDQTVTAEGRHATRGLTTVTEETPPPTPATDQTVTAEGRHGTRGEATVEDLLPVVGPLRDLRVSVGGRDYSDNVERGDWRIIRRTGVRSEARFRIIAQPGEIDIPRNGETVIATATLGGIVTLFGGYLDEPEIDAYTGTVGLYDLNLQSIGFRARLDDTLLTQLQGIDIVQLATAAEQIEALVDLLSGEGFTSTVTLPAADLPDPEDMRLQHIGPVLDRVSTLNNAIPVVSATKAVSVVARNLVTDDLRLDETNTELLRVEDSRQNYRTSQVTRGGDLLRTEGFTGRTDGRYRLGGLDNLEPQQSLFDVPIGNGVLWTDERARGGSRGSDNEAVLIETADGADLLPASIVVGSDRSIDKLSLEALLAPWSPSYTTYIARLEFAAGGAGVSPFHLQHARVYVPGHFPAHPSHWVVVGLTAVEKQEAETLVVRNDSSGALWVGNKVNEALFQLFLLPAAAAAAAAVSGATISLAILPGSPAPYVAEESAGMRLEGVELTDDGKDDLGIAMRASDGTEYGFPLADMTGTGGDDSEPYFWPLAVLSPFDSIEDVQDAIEKLRAGESKLVIVDTTQPRIDFPNRVLRATDTIIEIEATGIHTLDVDGVEVDLGGEGATWHWVQALQEVQETPASDPPPTGVNVRYRARWIYRESDGTIPRVERVSIQTDLALPEDGRRFGREQLDAHGRIKETLLADLITGFGKVVPEGSGVTIAQALIDRVPQLRGLTPADVLRVERVEMSAPYEGDLIQQTLRLLRRADESRYRDDWRRTLLERVGND